MQEDQNPDSYKAAFAFGVALIVMSISIVLSVANNPFASAGIFFAFFISLAGAYLIIDGLDEMIRAQRRE